MKRITIHPGARSRRFRFDLHNTVGVWSLVFLLILAVTGVMIGFERTTVPLFYQVTGSKPFERPKPSPAPPPGAKPIGVDASGFPARL